MSNAKITKYWCDICNKEVKQTDFVRLSIPVYRTFDSNDGNTHYNKKQYSTRIKDLCYECLEKIVKVQDIGVQCEKLIIKE